MRLVKLGNSDIMISRLTVGCWSFGSEAGSYWGKQEQSEADAVVREALEMDVNFFDTAFGYNDGASESALGKALAGMRDKAVICNKIPVLPREQLGGYEQSVRESLKRLNTDYVDVLMLHWPCSDAELLKANLSALAQMKRLGLAREIGVSNFGVATLEIARDVGISVAVNEFAYSLMARGMERHILPKCAQENISVAAYMPLMQGILSGKFLDISDIPPQRTRTIHFDSAKNPMARHGGPGAEAQVAHLLGALKNLAAQSGMSESRLALAYVLSKPGITTAIAGCRSLEQLRENALGASSELSDELISALDEASAPLYSKLGDNCDLWQSKENSRIW